MQPHLQPLGGKVTERPHPWIAFQVGMVEHPQLRGEFFDRFAPLGTAYAVWTGIGAVGSLIAGIVLFGESTDAVRITFAAVTILGVVGLKVSS
ncbi:QacE family quaternary ammonium compound efflux SMR transporter [Mesorhizobium sp. B4-1-3]|uniref:DMT family transporter n=1 Tax=Mesorhizobium sp. B4-1-3 TaxID=2589889 RepID=UPI001127CAE9|nr:SMR family transporter [Mesorhizobium sp. B4-1-3]TPI13655.1 QacE family quaternary ammonium compound efflux SMR transporter [Mesorhizobium sp. B4-1-3]